VARIRREKHKKSFHILQHLHRDEIDANTTGSWEVRSDVDDPSREKLTEVDRNYRELTMHHFHNPSPEPVFDLRDNSPPALPPCKMGICP
jgi:hypothetical protein